ncbi:hypothetical protein ACF0H5_010161 [Mactra antiquata]
MPPTADNTLGLRTQVSLTSQNSRLTHESMREFAAMSGDTSHHNGLPTNDFNEPRKSSRYDFFYKEPCLYSQKVYLNASKVFSSLKHESREELENPYYRKRDEQLNRQTSKVGLEDLDFEDDNEKRLTFELAFETLKYQRVFEDLFLECSFFSHFPEFQEDESLVYVVLWDYQSRKFQQRTPLDDEVLDSTVQSVEEAILEYKTKLNASLARHRIKAMAPSIEFLLPDKVRSKEEIRSKLPVFTWVNQLKTSIQTVVSELKDNNFTLVDYEDRFDGKVFYIDPHCPDMLVFTAECRDFLLEHHLLTGGHLVMQDKSSCIAPQSIKYLVGEDDDVIHVNAGSGVTTVHLASLMSQSSGHIHAFGALSSSAIQQTIEKFGAKKKTNISESKYKLVSYNKQKKKNSKGIEIHRKSSAEINNNIKVAGDSFLDIDTDDSKYKNVKVVLVTADCSKSGIANPIDFVVNEGEDMKILKYLSLGETDESKLGEMIANHGNLLKQAMKLNKVQAIVYMTRSINESENENVVTKAIEYANRVQQRKFPYRVVPPVLRFSGNEIENNIGIVGKYVKFQPSDRNSGCFVAVITREPEDIKEANKDLLERARARGLLGGKKKPKKQIEAETPVTNNEVEVEEEKLLEKRVKRAPRKLRTTQSNTIGFNYHKPSGTSVVKAQINSHTKVGARTKSTPILNKIHASKLRPLAEPLEKKEKTPKVAEHVKVVKHPAPFRKRKKKHTKK